MTTIIKFRDIKSIVQTMDVVSAMEAGFIQYSKGNTVVPSVGELSFEDPKGEVHIKYGYIKGDDYYVIKIASGFYDNPKLGIASSQGMMLLFNQKTGQPISILLDEGYLTDIRTAAAGALAAKYFAPKKINAIGIIGTGIQARLQLQFLQQHTPSKTVWVWGRTEANAQKFKEELGTEFDIHIAKTPAELAQHSNLIVCTTPAEAPLLKAADILPGTHITAIGSDTAKKQELAGEILQKADILISDSIPQSKSRGEVYQARKAGLISDEKIVELGTALQDAALQRTDENQISVVDLTGVAVQDIMITQAVYLDYLAKTNS